MSIATRRAELAAAINAELAGYTIDPYRGSSPAPQTGWLELEQTDTNGCTFTQVSCTFTIVLPLATDRTDFEPLQDSLTAPLIDAVTVAGGRGPVVKPSTEIVGQQALYALTCQFVTESE